VDEYGIHPSLELRRLFARQTIPSQGQSIERAQVLFVGLDANYSAQLLDYPDFFERILEYHEDGVAFWKEHGVHHPFLLAEYPLFRDRGGVPYHRRFSQMGLSPEFAEQVSFVELLNVPTTGRTTESVFWDLFDPGYAQRLVDLLTDGSRRLVILSGSVHRTLSAAARRTALRVPQLILPHVGSEQRIGESRIVRWRHFSSAISQRELVGMGDEIRAFCDAASETPVALSPTPPSVASSWPKPPFSEAYVPRAGPCRKKFEE